MKKASLGPPTRALNDGNALVFASLSLLLIPANKLSLLPGFWIPLMQRRSCRNVRHRRRFFGSIPSSPSPYLPITLQTFLELALRDQFQLWRSACVDHDSLRYVVLWTFLCSR